MHTPNKALWSALERIEFFQPTVPTVQRVVARLLTDYGRYVWFWDSREDCVDDRDGDGDDDDHDDVDHDCRGW